MPVHVTVSWGDSVLAVRTLRGRRGFALGERRGDFPLSREVLGTSHLPVVTWVGAEPIVPVVAGARRRVATARVGGGVDDDGPAAPADICYFRLLPGQRIVLELGEITVTATRTTGPRVRFQRPVSERRFIVALVATAVLHAALLTLSAYLLPAQAQHDEPWTPGPPPWGRWVSWERPRYEDFALPEPEPAPSDPSLRITGSVRSHVGVEVRSPVLPGEVAAPAAFEHRAGLQGPRDNPDPHFARALAFLDGGCWGGWVPVRPWGDPRAPVAPPGRDTSLGTEDVSARAPLWGEEIAPARGFGVTPRERVPGRGRKVLTFVGREPLHGSVPRVRD